MSGKDNDNVIHTQFGLGAALIAAYAPPPIIEIGKRVDDLLEERGWEEELHRLEAALKRAALDLFEHSQASAFCIDLDPPHKRLFVAGGEPAAIRRYFASDSNG